ncbi:restriction endonuclease subunit S [Pasteurella multocida]
MTNASLDDLVALQTEKIFVNKDPKLPYIGLEHMAQGEPRLLGTANSSSSISVNAVFKKGDILFGKLRPNLRKSIKAPFDGYCSTDILVLRSQDDVVPEFSAHIFQWERVFSAAVATAAGTKMPRTSWSDLKRFKVFKPESDQEQTRIAYILDTVDEAIAQTEAVIAKLKQVRAGMLHDLLSYGLDENGQLRDPVAHPEQFKDSPLGLIPSNWEVGPFSEIATINPPTPSTGLSPFNSISFIPMQDVDEEGNWVYRQTKELINCSGGYTPFIEGDVLFAKITPCMENGKGCHAIGLLNGFGMGSTEFHVLRPKSNTSARFVFHWSLTKSMRIRALAYMTGSAGQQRVEAGFFNHFLIPIPTTDEQGLIADVIDGADRQIEASWNELQKLKTLKSGLQDDLLTGRVRVPETIMEGAENA